MRALPRRSSSLQDDVHALRTRDARASRPARPIATGWDDGAPVAVREGPAWVRSVDSPRARGLAIPWLLLEILFLVAVAVLCAVAGLDAPVIAGVMVAAWLLVALGEWLRARADARAARARLRPAVRRSPTRARRPLVVRHERATTPCSTPRRRSARRLAFRRRSSRVAVVAADAPDAMLFPTATFAIFFMIVLPLSWAAHARRGALAAVHHRRELRLLRGLGLALLLPARVLDRRGTRCSRSRSTAAATPRARKQLLVVALAGNLGLLGYFKYYDFFVTSTNNLFALVGIDVPLEARSILLPVGISFFTFMAISYVVDVYRGDFEPVGLGTFAAYLSFFPHLVAGPIVRPGELIPQFQSPRDPRYVDTSRAFFLIGTGLFMKVVIANHLAANIVDEVFGAPNQHSSLEVLVGIYAYSVQIYADFFGYTNIAIGIALLLGFTFPQNFDAPYSATSITDFWRRWHMTLSRWLRDYLYIPLGGNRGGTLLTYRNLMLTMLIGGLWHGAGWTFVVWGGIHGTALVVERWWREPARLRRAAVDARAARVAPLRRRSRSSASRGSSSARTRSRTPGTSSCACSPPGASRRRSSPGACSPRSRSGSARSTSRAGSRSQIMARFSRLPIPAQAVVLSLALLVTHAMGPEGVAPFIYFQF